MAKTWKEVELSEGYQSLSPQDKFLAKKEYWDTVVAQKPEFLTLVSDEQKEAKKEFFGGTLVSELPDEAFKAKNVALVTLGDTIGTIGKSTFKLAEGIVQPVLHPMNTARDLGLLAAGAVEKLIPGFQASEKYADALGQVYKDRYGSIDALGKTIAEDPAGFLADVSVVGGVGLGGVGAIGKAAKIPSSGKFIDITSHTPTFQKAGEAVGKLIPKIDLSPEARVFKLYNEAFPSKKKTIGDLKSAKSDAISAVKAISDNFPEEGLVNPLTGDIFANRPTNRYEALIALDNAKKVIWDRATKLSSGATESGALIDLSALAKKAAKSTVDDFGEIAANTTKANISKNILDEAKLIGSQGKVTPTQSEKFLKQLYDDSKKLMESGDFTQYSKKDFYKNLYSELRNATDASIEATLGRAGYNEARSQYAAVRKAEDAIRNGANKYLQAGGQGQVGSLADFWSIEELVSGNIGKAATVQGTKQLLKYFKDKDVKVDRLFSEAAKLRKKPSPIVQTEVVDRIFNENRRFSEADILEQQKRLSGPKANIQIETEKRLGLPNLSAEKQGRAGYSDVPPIGNQRRINQESTGTVIVSGETASLERMPIPELENYIQSRYASGARQRELDMLENLYQKRVRGLHVEYKGRKVR